MTVLDDKFVSQDEQVDETAQNEVFVFPASFTQQRLWFIDQIRPKSAAYNIAFAVHLNGPIDSKRVEWTINEILIRHEALRTTFTSFSGKPMQVITPEVFLPLGVVDLTEFGHDEACSRAQTAIRKQASTPFDLAKDILIRAKLYKLAENEHYLALVKHHTITDAWSDAVFFREFSALYRGEELDELDLQFADFTEWQNEWLQGDVLKKQLDYWVEQLPDDLSLLQMPTDRSRPATRTFKGGQERVYLSTETQAKIAKILKKTGATPFMFHLAVTNILLYRYSQQQNIVIGTPIANRTRAEVENVMGFFTNTLAVHTPIQADDPFTVFLAKVRDTALGAFSNQDLPFDVLVDELKPDRDLSYNPIFQVMFEMQNGADAAVDIPSVTSKVTNIHNGHAHFDLTMRVEDKPEGLMVEAEYATDLFEADTMRRLLSHYEALVTSILSNPLESVAQLNMLAQAEKDRLLVDFNRPISVPSFNKTLHQLFEKQAAKTPSKIAVEYKGKQLTYSELNQKANQLAHLLRERGVGPDTLVGLGVERGFEMLIGLLGVLKAGGAYVPLDPGFPPDRLQYMLEDADVVALLTQVSLVDLFNQPQDKVICLDNWGEMAGFSAENPINQTKPSHLAYVIYTSGSTGKPKGVQLEHRTVVNFLYSMQKEPGFSATDIIVPVTTLSFDIAVLELFLPLILGAKMVLASRSVAADGDRLGKLLVEAQATVMQATPSTWRLMLEAGWPSDLKLKMLCGGEALPADLAQQLLATGGELWNMYGPTETTIWSAVKKIRPTDGKVVVGGPIANTTLHVVDRLGQLVPQGVPGELVIGGDGLARGYLHRLELTSEKFIPNNFGRGRIYKTGDLVRQLSNGDFEFLGRIDNQVKVRGYRIELGEIESTLTDHASVESAVVTVREDRPGNKQIVAYVIGNSHVETSQLRDHLKQQLPSYMVPNHIVVMQSFPLTPNGKIARKKLPAPNGFFKKTVAVDGTPRNSVEMRLCRIWEAVLDVPAVGIHDDFFDLGGHSLLAAQLFARIESEFDKSLPLSVLFQASTIDQLAKALDDGISDNWTSLVPIRPQGSKKPFFYVSPFLISVLTLQDLSHYVESDRPFYGVQPHGLSDDSEPHDNIPAMAAHYIKEIKTLQPHGPYHIGGHCAGSWVAYEMALQLQAAGDEVAFLAIVDNQPPHVAAPEVNRVKYFADRAIHYMRDGRLLGAVAWKLKLQYENSRFYRMGSNNSVAQRVQAVRSAHEQAFADYRPNGIYNGDLYFVRSSEHAAMDEKQWHLRWSELTTANFISEDVDATHASLLLQPNVRGLGQALNRQLLNF